ncbi:MAG: DUF2442 domain-containing protein [Treponema sp.]|nr:DUF2442 domain-containing protein [Treponema sp.]
MGQSYDYYISKGFDSKAAAYFSNGRRKPVKVVPQEQYKILIIFDNSEKRILDISRLIQKGTVYYPLHDKNIFKNCYIDSDYSLCWDKDPDVDSNIVWNNKIDIGSDTCYLDSEEVKL